MFAINHAATALLVKRRYPEARMVWLLISVQLMELLWVIFNYLGVEITTTEETVKSVSDIHLVYIPFSHSILSGVLLAGLGYLLMTKLTGRVTIGLAVGIGIVSHLILDLITHAPDIALAPGMDQPKFGLGLYGTVPLLAFVVEFIYGAFCWWVYGGRKALLAVIVVFNLGNLSMLSSAVPGPEELLAGRPMLIVTVIAAQIVITLILVGIFSEPSWLKIPSES